MLSNNTPRKFADGSKAAAHSLFWTSTAEANLPWKPPQPQQRFGIVRNGELAIRDSRAKPAYAPPLPPAFQREGHTPLPTCYGADKLFDGEIRLPRGDVGAQQYARAATTPSPARACVLIPAPFVARPCQVWSAGLQPRRQRLDWLAARSCDLGARDVAALCAAGMGEPRLRAHHVPGGCALDATGAQINHVYGGCARAGSTPDARRTHPALECDEPGVRTETVVGDTRTLLQCLHDGGKRTRTLRVYSRG